MRLPLLTLGSGWLLVLPPCLPQPRRHRAGRPLLPERLPPANPAAILRRPLRRFRRGAAALPHTAPMRARGRTDLAAPLPPPPPPAPPPSPSPPPPSSSHAPRPPLRARSGFRLSPSARRGPHVSRPPLPARGRSRSRCYFLPRRAGERRDGAGAILEPGARCGSRRRAGRALPAAKMSAGAEARGEAGTAPPPCAGAFPRAPPLRALPTAPGTGWDGAPALSARPRRRRGERPAGERHRHGQSEPGPRAAALPCSALCSPHTVTIGCPSRP